MINNRVFMANGLIRTYYYKNSYWPLTSVTGERIYMNVTEKRFRRWIYILVCIRSGSMLFATIHTISELFVLVNSAFFNSPLVTTRFQAVLFTNWKIKTILVDKKNCSSYFSVLNVYILQLLKTHKRSFNRS